MTDFYEYCRKRILNIIIIFFCTAAVYCVWLSHNIVTFDAEGLYSLKGIDWYKQWIAIDRWSLVVLKRLLNVFFINPFFSAAVFLIMFPLSVILWNYCFYNWRNRQESTPASIVFSLIYLTHPIWALQFGYRNQMEVITIEMALVPIAMLYMTSGMESGNKFKVFLAFLLAVFCFGGYQSFIFLFADACAAFLFIRAITLSNGEEKRYLKQFCFILLFVVAAFLAHLIISKIFQVMFHTAASEAAYLSGQFHWGKLPFSQNLEVIHRYLKQSLFGDAYVFDALYAASGALGLGIALKECIRKKHTFRTAFIILTFAGVLIIPFLLELVTAAEIVIRSQFAFVFSIAFLCGYITVWITEKEIMKNNRYAVPTILTAIFALFILFPQVQRNTRLLYTDVRVMEEDERHFTQIYYTALEKGAHPGDPICFVGGKTYFLDPTFSEYEIIGFSYFEYTAYYDCGKAVEAMRAYGMDVTYPTPEETERAEKLSKEMGIWPSGEDGIRVDNGLIIVRLR